MVNPSTLNLNATSPLSAGNRASITSPGSGGGVQQNPNFATSSTDLTGAGALLGGLLPLLMQAKGSGNASNQSAQQQQQNKEDQAKKDALSKALNALKLKPVTTPGAKEIGGGGTGTVGGLKFPPGTTQANIDAQAPGYLIAGIDMSTGEIIAQPDLMVGGGTLTGTGSIIDKIEPTGSYTTGPMGNIYDPKGDLYAIKSAGKYLIDNKNGTYTDSSTNKTVTANEAFSYTGGGWDPSSYDVGSSVSSGGGWSPTSDIPSIHKSLNVGSGSGGWSPESTYSPIDTTGYPNFSVGSSSPMTIPAINVSAPAISGAESFISKLGGGNNYYYPSSSSSSFNFSPSNWDIGGTLSNLVSAFNPFNWFGAQGGLASMSTPTMKNGGTVQHFAEGDAVTTNSTTPPATNTPAASTELTDWLTKIFGGINVGNVALGGGLGALLGSAFGPSTSTVNTGVDMSKVGNIAPRTTSFGMGPSNYVPYGMYGVPPQQAGNEYNNLLSNLGASGYTQPVTTPTPTQPTAANPFMSPYPVMTAPPSPPPAQNPFTIKSTGGLGGVVVPNQTNAPNNSFYTYGNQIDPSTILNTGASPMKDGGLSHEEGGALPAQHRIDLRQGSYVEGPGDGQSDDIPAMLADGEYVIDAETVAQLGNGSNKAGAKVLDNFRENIRAHKRGAPLNKIPPKSKSPLAYLKGAK